MHEFSTYTRLHTYEDVEQFVLLLQANNIEYIVEHERNVLDNIYLGNSFDPMFSIKVKNVDFLAVNDIFKKELLIDFDNIDTNYYLYNFSNNELIDVVNNANNWNYYDQALARKILNDKQIIIPEIIPNNSTIEYIPMRISTHFIVLEYILSILFAYAGIIIGVLTLSATKTTASGQKQMLYDNWTRKHSVYLLIIGIIRSLLNLLFFID